MAFKEDMSLDRARREFGGRSLEERNAYMRTAVRVAMAGLGKVVEKERMLRIEAEDALRSERERSERSRSERAKLSRSRDRYREEWERAKGREGA